MADTWIHPVTVFQRALFETAREILSPYVTLDGDRLIFKKNSFSWTGSHAYCRPKSDSNTIYADIIGSERDPLCRITVIFSKFEIEDEIAIFTLTEPPCIQGYPTTKPFV